MQTEPEVGGWRRGQGAGGAGLESRWASPGCSGARAQKPSWTPVGLTPAPHPLSASRGAAAQVAHRCPLGPSSESLHLWLGQRLVLLDVQDPRAGTMASARCPAAWCECGQLTSRCAERGCTRARAVPALRSAAPSLRARTRLSLPPSRSRTPDGKRPRDPWPPSSPLPWSLAPLDPVPQPGEARAGRPLISFGASPLLLPLPVSMRTVLLSFQSVNFTCSQLPRAPPQVPPEMCQVCSPL